MRANGKVPLCHLPGVAAHSMIAVGRQLRAAAPRASRAAWGQTKSGNVSCDKMAEIQEAN